MAFKATAGVPEEPTFKVPSRIEKALREGYKEIGGPVGELTDEQIDQALMTYMGIERPTAKDYLMDFFEMAPAMMGLPVGITAAGAAKLFKPLAKEFRKRTKPRTEWIKRIIEERKAGLEDIWDLETIQHEAKTLQTQRKTYRGIIKGLRNIPQETAELVESVGLHRAKKTGGGYFPFEKRIEVGARARTPIETVGHEFEHAKTIAARKAAELPVTAAELARLEGTAYEFGVIFEREVRKLPKGQKITSEVFEELYERAGKRARARWGEDPSKWSKEEIVKGAKERRITQKGLTELQMKEPGLSSKLLKMSKEEFRKYEGFPGYPFDIKTKRGQKSQIDFLLSVTSDVKTKGRLKDIQTLMKKDIFSYEDLTEYRSRLIEGD